MSPENFRPKEVDPGNLRGAEMENKIARIIEKFPGVTEVVVTKQNTEEDKQKRDLTVQIATDKLPEGLITVFVQSKSSRRGVQHFVEEVGKKLKESESNNKTCVKDWMLENRMILLNADLETSRSGRETRHLSDEEILNDFEIQLQEIINFELGINIFGGTNTNGIE